MREKGKRDRSGRESDDTGIGKRVRIQVLERERERDGSV